MYFQVFFRKLLRNAEKHGNIAHLGRLLQVLEDAVKKSQLNIIHPGLANPPYLTRKICKARPLVTAKIRQDFLDLYHQPASPTVPDKQ